MCEFLQTLYWQDFHLRTLKAWEPACGECDMARPLAEYFRSVFASDVFDYRDKRGKEQVAQLDFLWPDPRFNRSDSDWIVTNPPFNLAEQFAHRALDLAEEGVALLVRTAFLESQQRYHSLFKHRAPQYVLQFVERVPMLKGRLVENSATATAYCWLVWKQCPAFVETRLSWIPPCRDRLEKKGDYPPAGLDLGKS